MRCPICDADGELELRESREITVGSVAARLDRRPVVACPEGHGAVPAALVGATMEAADQQVPRARSRLLRSDACHRCGTALTMPVRRTTRSVSVDPPDGRVLTVHLDLPMTRCGSCGADQVPSRSQEDLTVVVPALFAGP